MFGQDEQNVSDNASIRTQTTRILTPAASDNTLNLSDGIGFSSKKRKRDGSTMEDLLKDKFVVKVRCLMLRRTRGY
jgi:hypothetical protein